MRILVFQHIAIEHPGIFRDFLAADGIAWEAVELDAGDAIPDLGRYDALWVMGGPMDVWQETEHPWLVREKQAIREAVVSRHMPYLGVCLGHQLLAAALGGTVGPMRAPEVGLLEVELTEAGTRDPLLAGFPPRIRCLQWHGAEVSKAPEGAVVLARSDASPVQAFRYGRAAYGLQYHVELTGQTVPEWSCVPEYEASLERTLGAAALPAFKAEAERLIPAFNRDARRLYDNFMRVAQRQPA
jgi:GMP synthase-like glutamine amidotransferase